MVRISISSLIHKILFLKMMWWRRLISIVIWWGNKTLVISWIVSRKLVWILRKVWLLILNRMFLFRAFFLVNLIWLYLFFVLIFLWVHNFYIIDVLYGWYNTDNLYQIWIAGKPTNIKIVFLITTFSRRYNKKKFRRHASEL